jgi:molybdopterin-guanine dinucleotide biosynthesis protein B
MKIIGVVGTKNTGKTTLVTYLVEELIKRNFIVGTVKHTHHDFDLDEKDTWKHRESGAKIVVGSGKNTFFQIQEQMDLKKILKIMKIILDPDFVVIEGFKSMNYPKVSTTTDMDDDYTITQVDVFNMDNNDVNKMVDLIQERAYDIIPNANCGECGYENCDEMAKALIKGQTSEKLCKMRKLNEVELYIGDEKIPLNAFVQNFIKSSLLGMINSLKTDSVGAIEKEKLELFIRNAED